MIQCTFHRIPVIECYFDHINHAMIMDCDNLGLLFLSFFINAIDPVSSPHILYFLLTIDATYNSIFGHSFIESVLRKSLDLIPKADDVLLRRLEVPLSV